MASLSNRTEDSSPTTAKLAPHMRIIMAARAAAAKSAESKELPAKDSASRASDVFRFLDLPAEIRNKIYRAALVESTPIPIRSEYHPGNVYWHEYFVPNRRTSYRTGEFSGHDAENTRNMHTTYSINRDSPFSTKVKPTIYRTIIITGFLAVNQQIRKEATSIYYGENTFRFLSMNATIPFLQDQPVTTLRLITSAQFVFRMVEWYCDDDEDKGDYHDQYERPYHAPLEDVAKICSNLGRFWQLRLRRLSIILDDQDADFAGMVYDQPIQDWWDWIHILCKNITELDLLGIRYNGWMDQRLLDDDSTENDNDDVVYVDTVREEKKFVMKANKYFWDFLAPRMLKRIGDAHDPESLSDRRINVVSTLVWSVKYTFKLIGQGHIYDFGDEHDPWLEDHAEDLI